MQPVAAFADVVKLLVGQANLPEHACTRNLHTPNAERLCAQGIPAA